ncbi:MAG: hypothetical protein WBQ43_18125, partial [Terriglobales bacterium]
PNLLVRSQALYPIELRAHPMELCFCIIKEREWFRPTRSAQSVPKQYPSGFDLRLHITPNAALVVQIAASLKK